MGLGGVVRVGVGNAPAGSCGFHAGSNGGEGGDELGQRPCERHACVAYREGDELHMPPVSLEGRDEMGVLRGLGFEFGVTSEVPAISDLDDDEGAEALVEGGRSGPGRGSRVPLWRRLGLALFHVQRRRVPRFLPVIVSIRGYNGMRPCTPRRPL